MIIEQQPSLKIQREIFRANIVQKRTGFQNNSKGRMAQSHSERQTLYNESLILAQDERWRRA